MKKKLHMIGNAHLDPVWLWRWREGFQENKATFLSALDRMDEFDDFIFTSSSAQFYKWIEENAPELFERIKARVQEGRWVICGGWWVQPDCNIPSGESFVRHALLSQNYFYEKFGVTAHTGYCVDSFGHNGMLPQILKKSGMDQYVFMRPGPHEKELPGEVFLWEAPDGSQVKAFRIHSSYGSFGDMEEKIRDSLTVFPDNLDHMMCFYGVGNHGGGPTIENIETIHRMQEEIKDAEIVFSNPDEYFRDIEGCDLPVVKDDLQHHAAGCYAAESMVKTMNRKAENVLLSAEKFSVLCEQLKKAKYGRGLNQEWETLLFNQFHDIMAGSSLESAYYDARNQLGGVIAAADRCENNAVQSISFGIDIPYEKGTLPVVVFNPHSWTVTKAVEIETGLFETGLLLDQLQIVDSKGRSVPFQAIDSACKVPNRKRITFIAEVPALGYELFLVRKGEATKKQDPDSECVLENQKLKVSFDKQRGTISSIYDKRIGREILAQPVRARVIEDDTDTWGHTLKKLDQEIGEFAFVSAKVLDCGAVRKAVRITSKYGNSTLTQTFALYEDSDEIEVKTKVNWQEQRKALKLDFVICDKESTGTCEIPFGYKVKKNDGYEEPMQCWADVSGDNVGLSVLNDGKYSVDFRPGTLGFTVLRSPVYAHHDPYMLSEEEDYSYIDQGIQEFTYVLKPHNGDWKTNGTVKAAMLLNQPLCVMFETFHQGNLPQSYCGFSVDCENVLVTAIKPAYQGDEIVIRAYESFGKPVTAGIRLFGIEFQAEFGAHEIKTFAVNAEGKVREVNLIEWPV